MSFPTPAVPPYRFQTELGTAFGTHLDADFNEVVRVLNSVLAQLQLIQRDDGDIRNLTVHSDAFTSDALALMAGSSVASDIDWRPRGAWVTSTLYEVGNIIETGTTAVAYVCAVEHVAGTFATDYANHKWVVLSSPRTLLSADITTALGFTPVNVAGDTMLGALTLVTGSKIGGASGMTFSDALLGQDLITIDKGFYSSYASAASDIVYGYAANIVRASGDFTTVGSQSSAIGALTGGSLPMFGANFNALALAMSTSALIGIEVDIANFNPSNTSNKYGLYLLFTNRVGTVAGAYDYTFPNAGTYTSAGGGLGSNYYNKNAIAIQIESAQPSSIGEFCGWTRGIQFDEYALSPQVDLTYTGQIAYPIGVDFSRLHYYGGINPLTAYRMEAAIALRDLQAIWWNRDPSTAATATNKIRTYFNPAIGRWVIDNAGSEKFGVDVATGSIYANGALFTTVSLADNNTWTGTNTFNNTVTLATNLVFSGARRITGDFTNATVASRTMVQTTSANSATEFGILPTGTGGVAALYVLSSSAANNCAVGRISVDATQMQIASGIVGAAAYIPMTFGAGGVERLRIDNTTGQVIVNATVVTNIACKFRVNGIIQCDNPVSFSVHRNGVNFAIANNTPTIIDFTTEVFDDNLSYDPATDRYTPPAGKYVLMGSCLAAASVDQGAVVVSVYKNGALEKSGNVATMSGAGSTGSQAHCIVSANGTDYFQLVVTQVTGGGLTMSGLASDTWFQGYRIG